jgi:uncharacterized membrane protein
MNTASSPSDGPSGLLHAALPLGLIGLALLGSAAAFPFLPATIPSHLNIHGEVDGTLPKAIGAFLLPLLSGGTWALLRHFARRPTVSPAGRVAIETIAVLTTTLLVLVHALMLALALVPGLPTARPLAVAFCLFWAVIALLLPRLPRNPVAGIRTPWTLRDDENWARTHRLGGQMAFAAAAFGLVACWFSLPSVALGFVGVSAIVPAIYSFWLSREETHLSSSIASMTGPKRKKPRGEPRLSSFRLASWARAVRGLMRERRGVPALRDRLPKPRRLRGRQASDLLRGRPRRYTW